MVHQEVWHVLLPHLQKPKSFITQDLRPLLQITLDFFRHHFYFYQFLLVETNQNISFFIGFSPFSLPLLGILRL